MRDLRRVSRLYSSERWQVLGLAVVVILSCLTGLLQPWPMAVLADQVLGGKPAASWMPEGWGSMSVPAQIGWLALLMFLFAASHALLAAAASLLAIRLGLQGLARIRTQLFARMQCMSIQSRQTRAAGDLIYRATWDACSFQTLFQQIVHHALASLVTLVLMSAILWRLNPALALAALAAVPVLLAVIRWMGPAMRARGEVAQREDSLVVGRLQQMIQGLALIQAFRLESRQQADFDQAAGNARASRFSQHRSELLYNCAVAGVFAVSTAVIAGWGGLKASEGAVTLGGLLVFLAYLRQLYEPLNQLSHMGSTLAAAGAGVRRVFEILDLPEPIVSPQAPVPLKSCRSDLKAPDSPLVEFRGVGFSYAADQVLLRDFSLALSFNETVALVGPSGIGKTTVLQLIPRFLDAQRGEVNWLGTDVRRLDLAELRGCVAFVHQEPLLLPGTIAQNIALGRIEASPGAIVQAARDADADEFIRKLPMGYETLVGEGASRLSVGERQRIGLARAFLADPRLVLLDEPTSALDADSEARVLDSLQRFLRGRAAIIVTHRSAALRIADRVVQMPAHP